MKKPIIFGMRFKALIAAFVLMLFANSTASAYCSMYVNQQNLGYYMYINMVEFNSQVIQKWDAPRDAQGKVIDGSTPNPAAATGLYGYRAIDVNNPVIQAEKKKSYDVRVHGGALYLYYDANSTLPENITPQIQYGQEYKIYIDFDQNGNFDSEDYMGYQSNDGDDPSGTINITIPANAKTGITTMRIVSDYWGMNGSVLTSCLANYGEARDFAINIKAGVDIGISSITTPANPLTAGIHTVTAMLKNYSAEVVTKCTIRWTVDGVSQTPVNWTGTLGALQQQEVTLGNYNFASKGKITAYKIIATTEKPNGEDDGVLTNDASPLFVASIPLPPDTYYIGGAGSIVPTLKEFTDLLNNSGILGDGDVIIRIRPGTYTGPFIMDNFPHGNNNFVFENDPDNPGNVNITAATNSSNYVWYINNVPNVTFRNLIFNVTNPSNYGGKIFMIRGNANNYTFEGNTFNGLTAVDQTSFKYSSIDCQATQMNNHKYLTNIFNNGAMSLVLLNPSLNSNGLLIDDNRFNTFTNRAIQVEGIVKGVISNNILTASTTPSYGGIFVQDGMTITKNTISGIVGINTTSSAISVIHNSINAPTTITNNQIIESTGINGISAVGISTGEISNNTIDLHNANLNSATNGIVLASTTLGTDKVIISENNITMQNGYGINIVNHATDITKNKIIVSDASSKVMLKSISATGSTGMILMNEVIGSGEAMEIDNSAFTIAYNSILTLGSADVLTMESGNNKVYRNNFVNKGTGSAFAITALNTNTLGGNNYVSATGTIGKIGGTTYTEITQLLPIDIYARSTDPKYKSNSNLKIVLFKDELAFYTPLTNVSWPEGYQTEYEETTFDGKSREGVYYVGAYNIFPVVEVLAYTKELIDCSGAEELILATAAITSEGSQPGYQWFKDGISIPGASSHILNFDTFDYTVSGIYTCQVSWSGAKSKTTGPIPVYALTIPAIVEQPQEVINAVIGNDYSFNVHVHYRGLIPPYYKDYFQWYKYDVSTNDSIPLPNDSRFAGTQSSDFSINNLEATDICKPGDFYFVKVVGQCGTVYSDPFVISEAPEVVFRDNPESLNPCPGADIVLTANAIAPQGFSLTYKWLKNGVDLTDGTKFNGVNTNKLQIFDVQDVDQGNYVCVATIPELPTSKNSNAGILTLKDIPQGVVIGTADISTKRGNDVTMKVDLIKGTEPLTIKWYYKEELLKEGVWTVFEGDKLLTLLLEAVNENQSGEYKCVLENECQKTEIIFNLTVTKWEEANSVEVISENGYSLYTCMPNPSTGSTKIRFEMPQTDNAVITLIDQTGRTVSVLFNGVANKGMNVLDINTDSLNVASGVYFYMITANGFNASLPMVIVK